MPGGCSRSSPCGEEGGGQVGRTPRAPPPGHPCSPGCLPSVLIGLFFVSVSSSPFFPQRLSQRPFPGYQLPR